MNRILVVDDDKYIRDLLSINLKDAGFSVETSTDGEDALLKLEKEKFDLAIVDIMMPKMDGNELTQLIREYYNMPIILLTAKDQIADKEKGFLAGADDYMVKPFEPKELLFRMKNLFRLYHITNEEKLTVGNLLINKKSYEVTVDGKTYLLPLKEFELLFYLASHAGKVLSRGQIIDHVWGYDYDGDERTVDVHIKRLRERFKKLTDSVHIKTMRGVGYKLEVVL